MQPQQQPYYNPNPQPAGDPYSFIMNSQGGAPKPPGVANSNNMGQKILVVLGIAAVLVVAVIVVFTVLQSGNKTDKAALLKIAQQQNEIIRLSNAANTKADTQTVKNFAIGTQLSVQTDQITLLNYMAKHGGKPKPKVLALGTHAATSDKLLKSAEATSTYDSTYTNIMTTQIAEYQTSIRKAYGTATNKTLKVALAKDQASAELLLKNAMSAKAKI